MAGVSESRSERKERTRRAILDAALALCDEQPLAALSLRQVAREVGVVPTAFYRHFASLDDLGLALVEESFGSLRALMREVRSDATALDTIVDRSLDVLVEHVAAQRGHFGFIARERSAGPRVVREEIRRQIELSERELVVDLARLPGTEQWAAEDLQALANLIVTSVVATAEQIVSDGPPAEVDVVARARTQLKMVLVGARSWSSGG